MRYVQGVRNEHKMFVEDSLGKMDSSRGRPDPKKDVVPVEGRVGFKSQIMA